MPQIGYQECSGCGLMFNEATEVAELDSHDCNPSQKYTVEVNIGGWLLVQWAPHFDTEAEAEAWAYDPKHNWDGEVRVVTAY
jgi:hypothetical protein